MHCLVLLLQCLRFLGGILMFGLNKTGFYSYILGTAIGVAGPFIGFWRRNVMTILSSSFTAFIGILFCDIMRAERKSTYVKKYFTK